MDKLRLKLDEIFQKYGVSEEDVKEVGLMLDELGEPELDTTKEEFEVPGEDYGDEDEE